MHDTFFFTDVHGQMQLFVAMMEWIKQQDEEATIVFGGDACDRGPNGFQIMNMLLDDPKVIYLKGNHEDLFVTAAQGLADMYPQRMWTFNEAKTLVQEAMHKDEDIRLHIYNGGLITLTDWMMSGMDMDFVEQIRALPVVFRSEVCDFCHAGGSPTTFEICLDNQYNEILSKEHDVTNMIWDRNCFGLGWFKDRICVHGHTPTTMLPAKFYGSMDKSEAHIHPAWWVGPFEKERWPGLKIDMDTGMTWTGRAWVLNCSTMQATSFFDTSFSETDITSEDSTHNIQIGLENYKIK